MVNSVFYKDLQPEQLLSKVNAFPVAYLPIGTLEWHGRHMPLGTDMLVPEAVFEKVAKNVGGVVLPPLFLAPDIQQKIKQRKFAGMEICGFEKNKPHELFGNCYHISNHLFKKILMAVAENLQRNGFKYLVAHGHGPSINIFSQNKKKILKKYGITCFTLFDLGYEGKDGIQTDHAAANETSLVMAINQDLVDIENLAKDKIPIAIWGKDPQTSASVEYGKDVFNKNVEKISKTLKSIVKKVDFIEELTFSNEKSLIETLS